MTFDVVAPPSDLGGGDERAGHEVFDRTCVVCHGDGAAGTTRAPPLAGGDYEAAYVAERVRRSGSADNPAYDGLTGGIMPFWSAQRLSDDELRDLIAYVTGLASAPPVVPDDGGTPSGGPTFGLGRNPIAGGRVATARGIAPQRVKRRERAPSAREASRRSV